MKKVLFILMAVIGLSLFASAQPRQPEKPGVGPAGELTTAEAKYEGGIYGSIGGVKGTFKLDEKNGRVVFYRKTDGHEMFSIPYHALLVIYPDSKVAVSKTGNVVSHVPLPGAGFGSMLKERAKFMVVTFDDPDIDVRGTANFRFSDKKTLLDFINTLGTHAKMTQRGDAYYRSVNDQP